MYSLSDYGMMIADRIRVGSYAEALRRTVGPDSVVLDLGTGTGILALLACRAGARKVYAVEPTAVVHLAEELAAANGYADRIVFIRDVSTRIARLDDPVDVVVADLHGAVPQYGGGVAALIDARRFLRSGGTMIPRVETVWAAVVEAEAIYHNAVDPWADRLNGFDLGAARAMIVNSPIKARVQPSNLLTAPQRWVTLDYATLASPHAAAELTFAIERPGIAHGLALWFDTLLTDGCGFSNAPGRDAVIYGQLFFPWLEPVRVEAGDRATVSMRASLVDSEYVWVWNSQLHAASTNAPTASFRQSTIASGPLSLDRVRREAPDAIAEVSSSVRITQFIANAIDGQTSLREISAKLRAAFPHDFASDAAALARVRAVINSD